MLFSCQPKHPVMVERALKEMSRENQQKFQKVLDHFQSDDKKLKVAYKIIENINDFSALTGDPIEKYEVLFDILEKKPKNYRHKIPWYSNDLSNLIDSLEPTIGAFDSSRLRIVNDSDAMSADFLINYINQAFDAWQNPWSKNVSFDDFCNYILPYRNNTSKLEDWRSLILKKYNWIYDSIHNGSDITEVARLLNKDTELAFSNGLSRYPVPISTTNIIRAGFGGCTDMSNYKAMVMRAFGIPASIDYIPQWGNDHQTHTWNSIQDKNGNWVDFSEAAIDSNTRVAFKYRLSKIYRKTLDKNKRWEHLQNISNNNIPSLFKNARNLDVTNQYIAVSNVKLKLETIDNNYKAVFLCVFNNKGFTAMDFCYDRSKIKRSIIY